MRRLAGRITADASSRQIRRPARLSGSPRFPAR